MVEIRRGLGEGERLPWLEPVEDEDEYPEQGGGFGRLIVAGVAVLAAIAIIVGGVLWLRHARARQAEIGTLIRAPTEPYKTRPADPGGMEIASAGAVAERTGVGGDIDSPLDLAAIPEQPVTGPGSDEGMRVVAPPPAPAAVAAVPAGKAAVVGAAVPAVKAAPAVVALPLHQPAAGPPPHAARGEDLKADATGGAGTIQLGAFSTSAKAQGAWKGLSGRFGFLKDMTSAIVPVASGDVTLYRLRASGPGAAKLCARLKVAGETCSVV